MNSVVVADIPSRAFFDIDILDEFLVENSTFAKLQPNAFAANSTLELECLNEFAHLISFCRNKTTNPSQQFHWQRAWRKSQHRNWREHSFPAERVSSFESAGICR